MLKRTKPDITELEPALTKAMKLYKNKYPKLQRLAKKHNVKANLGKRKILSELIKKGLTFQKGTTPQRSQIPGKTKEPKQLNLKGDIATSIISDHKIEIESDD